MTVSSLAQDWALLAFKRDIFVSMDGPSVKDPGPIRRGESALLLTWDIGRWQEADHGVPEPEAALLGTAVRPEADADPVTGAGDGAGEPVWEVPGGGATATELADHWVGDGGAVKEENVVPLAAGAATLDLKRAPFQCDVHNLKHSFGFCCKSAQRHAHTSDNKQNCHN